MARDVGCKPEKPPFNYLGVKVGENMSRIESWKEIVSKVVNKLSSWKIKTLSVGGRLTLLKSVLGSLPTYFMSIYKVPKAVVKYLESIRNRCFIGADLDERKITWINWKKVLAAKQDGGLGVNSIFALNHALLFKWVWRFRTQPTALWARVVRVIHGNEGLLNEPIRKSYANSAWLSIVKAISSLKANGLDLLEFCQRKVGNGHDTRFWLDKWVGHQTLKEAYPRIFALELDKEIKVVTKLNQRDGIGTYRRMVRNGVEEEQLKEMHNAISMVMLAPVPDRWIWTLDGSRTYTVRSAREHIDKKLMCTGGEPTRWCKLIPKKVNVLAWKISIDKLPTRINLDARGIDVPSTLCPICDGAIENTSHLFFQCSFASQIYDMLGRWWGISIPLLLNFQQWLDWFLSLRLKKMQRSILEATFFSLWWHVWNYRNSCIFQLTRPNQNVIFDNFTLATFNWIRGRCNRSKFSWDGWLQNPSQV